MTLKTILKKHGIKIRGLESKICDWAFGQHKWVHEALHEESQKNAQLEKLNTELHERAKDYREEVQKLQSEVLVLKEKFKSVDDQAWKYAQEINKLKLDLQTANRMTGYLRNRIEDLDLTIVKQEELPF